MSDPHVMCYMKASSVHLPCRLQIRSAASRANKSTASMGKFDRRAAGEKVRLHLVLTASSRSCTRGQARSF